MQHTASDLIALQGLLFAAVVAFASSIWILGSDHKAPRDRTVSLLLSSAALWVFAYVLWQTAAEPLQAQFWLKALYFIGSFIPVAFTLFAATIMNERLPSSRILLALFVPNALIFWAIYFADVVVGRSVVVLTPAGGTGLFLLAFHFASFALIGLALLFRGMRQERHSVHASPLLLLAGGIAMMVPVFLLLYFYITISGDGITLIVPMSVLVGVLLIGVSTMRLRTRAEADIFGIDILIFVVLFMLAADTVAAARDQAELAVRITVLILLMIFGVLMIRTHAKELRRLRKIESMHDVLVRMNGKLLEADRIKTKFVSFASHQLRAPIGGIRGYLDMMRKGDFGKLTKKQEHVIDMNLDALERLTSTIKTFLDLTKLEFGKFDLFRTEVDVQDLVGHAIDEMRPAVERKGLTLEVDVTKGLPKILADAGKLHHVLVNLIDNAVKYTEKGKVTVVAAREHDQIVFKVKDTGIGLTRKDRERIFHVFERGISAVKLESSGAGLGLHIVKNIVEAHHGRIIVESGGRDTGSTFGFGIPITA